MKGSFLSRFLYVTFTAEAQKTEEILNFLRENHIKSFEYHRADGVFGFSLPYFEARRLARLAPALHATLSRRTEGLLYRLWGARQRAGLALGALLSLGLFIASGQVVWDVRVSGNERLGEGQILAHLQNCGLHTGTPLAGFDRTAFSAELRRACADIAFVGVNFRGTVAYVEIIETDPSLLTPVGQGAANLIAAEDGVIVSLSVAAGDTRVHAGQVVKKGDLLVSGVTEGTAGSRFVYAAGEVIARVRHETRITVLREYEAAGAEGRQLAGLSLGFFQKNINIYTNSRNLPTEYATIYEEVPFILPGGIRLPVSLTRTVAVTQEKTAAAYSDTELVAEAYRRLGEALSAALKGKELLYRRVSGEFCEGGYTLICEWEALENIAAVQEFEVR